MSQLTNQTHQINQAIEVDAVAGRALIAGRLVPITALSGGALRVGGPDGPTLRPISFGARRQATAVGVSSTPADADRVAQSVVTAVTTAALGLEVGGTGSGVGRTGVAGPSELTPEVCALALWLAGAGDGGPPFWQTAVRVAAATGWAAEQIDAAAAITIDRLAVELGVAAAVAPAAVAPVVAGPDDGWHRIVFADNPSDADAEADFPSPADPDPADPDPTGPDATADPADPAEAVGLLVRDLITRSRPTSRTAENPGESSTSDDLNAVPNPSTVPNPSAGRNANASTNRGASPDLHSTSEGWDGTEHRTGVVHADASLSAAAGFGRTAGFWPGTEDSPFREFSQDSDFIWTMPTNSSDGTAIDASTGSGVESRALATESDLGGFAVRAVTRTASASLDLGKDVATRPRLDQRMSVGPDGRRPPITSARSATATTLPSPQPSPSAAFALTSPAPAVVQVDVGSLADALAGALRDEADLRGLLP